MSASIRLTPAQLELLGELLGDGLYITKYGRYDRTVRALERKGMVRVDEADYSRLGQDHWVVTELGQAWLRRQ